MSGVAETLSEVIAANERLVLRQLALQVFFLGATDDAARARLNAPERP